MKATLLLMSLMVLVPQFVDSRIYYYYYYQQPNPNEVRYETQYVLVHNAYGSYYQAVQVPIQNIPPPTTTTTTPPPPAEISPTTFFAHSKALPMQLYSNYICGVFSQPRHNSFGFGKRSSGPTSNLIVRDFLQLLRCFFGNENNNLKSNESDSTDKRDMNNDQKRDTSSEEVTQFNSVDEITRWIRNKLVRGISASTVEKLKMALNDVLNVDELEFLVGAIYDDKINLANEASAKVSMFYVSDPAFSPSSLADADKKRLLIDLILVTNGRAECDGCDVDFGNADEIADALYRKGLPQEMNQKQVRAALAGIKFLSEAKLSATDASKIFKKFVDDFTAANRVVHKRQAIDNVTDEHDDSGDETNESPEDEDDDEDDEDKSFESFLSTILGKGNRRKRSNYYYYQPTFDKQIACFTLYNYITGSPYCGVQAVASQMYDYLQCSTVTSPLQPVVTSPTTITPPPTTTTTSRPTTATTPRPATTTTPRPATTTTQRPATATTPRPATTTTPRPATTTPPVQCGVSDIATRSARVATSDLFVSPRIVGGHMAGTCTTYPWMVRLTINGNEVCGATVLDERHILTAAHCVSNKFQIKATVGEYDTSMLEGTEQVFDVNMNTGVSIHPDYNSYAKTNDVAVLTLDKPINFDEICAAPICLNPTFVPTSGQSCTIAGWGATSENSGTASTTLQETSISTFPGTECANKFPNAGTGYFTDPTKQLCAGQPNAGGVDSCEGDSGGPLMCFDPFTSTWIAAGIVSYGEGCARVGQPGVYAQTSSYYGWIQQQLKN